MKYTIEQIEQKYNQLPEDIKDLISSAETTDAIVRIGEKKKLRIDQLTELVDETGLVMLGFTPANEFLGNVRSRLGISLELAKEIVTEIDSSILANLRDSIRNLYAGKVVSDTRFVSPEQEDSADDYREPVEEDKDVEIIDREKVLREIESPEEIEATEVLKDMVGSDEEVEVGAKEEGLEKVVGSEGGGFVKSEFSGGVVGLDSSKDVESLGVPGMSVGENKAREESVQEEKHEIIADLPDEIIPYDEKNKVLGGVNKTSIISHKLSSIVETPSEEVVIKEESKNNIVSSDPYRENF